VKVVKLGRNGRVYIPKAVRDQAGLEAGQYLQVDIRADGAIVLRPLANQPVEIYSGTRIEEFLAEDTLPVSLRKRVEARLADLRES